VLEVAMRERFAAVAQASGLLCLVTAGALVDASLGFLVAGGGLVLIGVAEERKRNAR
jgi:hypothetical protein